MPHRENQNFPGCLANLPIASRDPKSEGILGHTRHQQHSRSLLLPQYIHTLNTASL